MLAPKYPLCESGPTLPIHPLQPTSWRGGALKPGLIVFDFDGVLTDNRVLVLDNGQEAVFCNRSDGMAIGTLRRAGIPVIILSNLGQERDVAQAKALGALAFLVKAHLSLQDLVDRVDAALGMGTA